MSEIMKKIIIGCLTGITLTVFSEVKASELALNNVKPSDWDYLLYGELDSLYRVGFQKTPHVTTSRFVVAYAKRNDAIEAQYDLVFSHLEKTLGIHPVGDVHKNSQLHIAMIQKWFADDEAPDEYKAYKWLGLIPSTAK